MKKNLLVALTVLATATLHAERQNLPLLLDWKFIKQDVPLETPTADWKNVTVPHTWNDHDGGAASGRTKPNIQTPEEAAATAKAAPQKRPVIVTEDRHMKNGYYRGIGWYARTLDVPANWKDRRVFLRFEAVSQVAKIYLNGELLGEHRGAFTAFCLELTTHLKYGAANELRVLADNSLQSDVPPLRGDFNVCGGIYRPVEIIVTDELCISPLDFASPGVYLTTKNLTDDQAEVEVRAMIANGTGANANVPVEFEIQDAAGHVAATAKKEIALAAGKTLPVTETLHIANPLRWNGRSDPYLYTVTVKILKGDKPLDLVQQPLGLRTVAITEQDGFLLNGKRYPIHGVNRHQERQDKGWALSPADHREDAQLILGMGVTAVRNAHYPQSGYWHDLADHSGLLLWDELSLVDELTFSPAFDANAELQLRELIAQLYNHPSISFWGLFNELGPKFDTPKGDALLRRLKSVVQELDSSRLIVACSYGKKYLAIEQIADHTGYNRYPLWYPSVDQNTSRSMASQIQADSAYLGKRTALTEYGGGGNPAQHQEGELTPVAANSQFHPEEWQTHLHEENWKDLKDNPKIWGSFVWNMFDFASGWRREGGLISLNTKGLVTHDHKLKKDAYYFYKANWNPEPMVHLASHRMTPRRLATTDVEVFSNAAEVELKVNGESLGKMKPDDVKTVRWSAVKLKPGTNTVEAVASGPRGLISDSCKWVLDASR